MQPEAKDDIIGLIGKYDFANINTMSNDVATCIIGWAVYLRDTLNDFIVLCTVVSMSHGLRDSNKRP